VPQGKRLKQMENRSAGLADFSWFALGVLPAPGRPFGLQLFPLVQRQHPAKTQQHASVGLFQFGARLRDAVDLRQHLRFIRPVGFE
jgi:hypothetical protein